MPAIETIPETLPPGISSGLLSPGGTRSIPEFNGSIYYDPDYLALVARIQSRDKSTKFVNDAKMSAKDDSKKSYSVLIQLQGTFINDNKRGQFQEGTIAGRVGPISRPVTKAEAQALLLSLVMKLSPEQRTAIYSAVVLASQWIESATGGVVGTTSRSFQSAFDRINNTHNRIDIMTFGELNLYP